MLPVKAVTCGWQMQRMKYFRSRRRGETVGSWRAGKRDDRAAVVVDVAADKHGACFVFKAPSHCLL